MTSILSTGFSDYRDATFLKDRDIKPKDYFGTIPSGYSAFSNGASTITTPEKAVSIPVTAQSAYRPALPRSISMQPRTTTGLNTTPPPATRSRMNLSRTTSVCSVPTVIPESSIIPTTTTTATSESMNIFNDVGVGFRSRAFSEGANGQSQLQQQLQQQQVQSSRYKTELCRPFEENGKCKYSDKCQFAHGKHELRNLVRHPKYKTELCRTFHTSGFCPYGPRCHFIHNTEDANPTRPSNAQQSNFAQQSFGQSSNAMSVPEPNVSNHYQNSRPSQLELMGKQFSVDSGIGAYTQSSYSPNSNSPLNGSPISDVLSNHAVLSPLSPPISGSRFSFTNNMLSGNNDSFSRATNISSNYGYCGVDASSCTPPNSTFDLLKQQINPAGYELTDDTVFEPLTPPDSDRESMTGSPSSRTSQQRLPIFRCLSHSD